MARSKEALERRAHKRGITLKEQRILDNKNDMKLLKKKPSMISKEKIEDKNESTAVQYWDCKFCNNKNFEFRIDCNRCRRDKKLSLLKTIDTLDFSSGKSELNSNLNSWNSNISPDLIHRNSILREIIIQEISSGVLCPELSDEERQRGYILVDRSNRKQNKKLLQKTTLQRIIKHKK